jgi:regulatory protein
MLPQKRVKRTKTPEQALASLQRLCARAERSSGDAMRLMATWEVENNRRQEVLQKLISDKFIDDKRYAEAFVREKTSLSAWGEYKIRAALKRKGISESIINDVLNQINPNTNIERLTQRLSRKVKSIKYDTPYQLKTKLLRYGISLGFQMEQVLTSVEQVMKSINQENQCDEDIFF